VFDDDDVVIFSTHVTNDTSSLQSLLDVEIARGLIEHIDAEVLCYDNHQIRRRYHQ